MREVRISARQMRQRFNGCEPGYIANVCHAACCRSSASPTGTVISILPGEEIPLLERGWRVEAGLLQPRPGERMCPAQDKGTFLCGLHGTPDKPFGCIASPFTLNARDLLIVRNRYRLLRCYNDGERIPAYRAFGASLVLLFGEEVAADITAHLDMGGGDVSAPMPDGVYWALRYNDETKHGR